MKNNVIIPAVLFGLIAAAALVLSYRSPISVDSIVGFASVFGLIGVAGLEYRINWRRIFSR